MKLMYLPAAQEDIPRIFDLSKRLVDQYEDVKEIPYDRVMAWMERKIRDSIGDYVRILCDGLTVGYFHLYTNDENRLELDDFYILEPYRGKGIGTEVLKEILANADEDVMLYVFVRNTGAVRLYERLGFVEEKAVGNTRCILVYTKGEE